MCLVKLVLTVMALTAGVTLGALGLFSTGAGAAQRPSAASQGTIVAFGDSLTAGYGVAEGEAYPAQLEKKLQKAGYRWRVVNAGVSGETSSGALSRVDWILRLKPDIVILETGANDGLRGVDPRVTHANIDSIVTRLQKKGIVVVLAGMKMFASLGPRFTRDFDDIYPKEAARHHLILIPFFLTGVAGDPNLNQQDGIHPTGKGYRILIGKIYPYVLKAIERRQKQLAPTGK